MDQVRPLPTQSALRPRVRRLVGLSSSNPIRWRPRADPVQKRDPGERTTQKGLTNRGPLQKKRAGMSKAKVALARRLAVIMHRMLADRTPFNAAAAS